MADSLRQPRQRPASAREAASAERRWRRTGSARASLARRRKGRRQQQHRRRGVALRKEDLGQGLVRDSGQGLVRDLGKGLVGLRLLLPAARVVSRSPMQLSEERRQASGPAAAVPAGLVVVRPPGRPRKREASRRGLGPGPRRGCGVRATRPQGRQARPPGDPARAASRGCRRRRQPPLRNSLRLLPQA